MNKPTDNNDAQPPEPGATVTHFDDENSTWSKLAELGDSVGEEMAQRVSQAKGATFDDEEVDPGGQKRWHFARLYVLETSRPLADRYRDAFPECKTWSSPACYARAKKLLNDPDFQAEVQEVRRDFAAHEGLTAEGHAEQLRQHRDKALEAGDLSAANKAEELRGKVAGFYVERQHLVHENLDSDTAMNELVALLEGNPQIAAKLMSEMDPEQVRKIEARIDKPEHEGYDSPQHSQGDTHGDGEREDGDQG